MPPPPPPPLQMVQVNPPSISTVGTTLTADSVREVPLAVSTQRTVAARALDMSDSSDEHEKEDKRSKRRTVAKKKTTNKGNKANKKLKSGKAQKQFKLTADKAVPDPLIMKTVAFDLGDGGKGKELS
jgi:hypothetical protein